ncbi:MAG: LacI family DNA-binding transcriptional regulator [Planctomycetota bacterium]
MTTIPDIAKIAGVSNMTVSRVLNGNANYRRPAYARRAERIRRIADEMGYRPNSFARGVRSARFGTFGLLLGTDPYRSALPLPMLGGVYKALRERDLNLSMAMLPGNELASPETAPKLLLEQMSDGLLIYYTDHLPDGMVETIERVNLPAVWINTRLEKSCVYPADRDAGRTAAEHLLELGHTRIVFMDLANSPDDPAIHYSTIERFRGYSAAMEAAGLEPQLLWGRWPGVAGDDMATRVEAARRWLAADDRPTAVITLGQSNSTPLFCAAGQLGLELPRDLSMITFDSSALRIMGPRFTTMLIPQERVGAEAVALLDRMVAEPGSTPESVSVDFKFDPGETCAPPRSR